MIECNVNILGAIYTVKFGNKKDYPMLENCDGYTDTSCGEIIVYDMKDIENEVDRKKNLETYKNKVARHEVLHAFLYESGLANNSYNVEDIGWAENEEMVDWFAIQFRKIQSVYQQLEIDDR